MPVNPFKVIALLVARLQDIAIAGEDCYLCAPQSATMDGTEPDRRQWRIKGG